MHANALAMEQGLGVSATLCLWLSTHLFVSHGFFIYGQLMGNSEKLSLTFMRIVLTELIAQYSYLRAYIKVMTFEAH